MSTIWETSNTYGRCLCQSLLLKGICDSLQMFVRPLRSMDPPIIPPQRLETFIQDVFHNLSELHMHHKQLLDQLFEIQIKEHPIISSIAALMHSVFLNSRDAYLKYIPNFPIAEYRIDNEMASNPQFKPFVDVSLPLSPTLQFGA